MRMNYVSKIQSNMKRHRLIQTSKKTSQILDGSYKSIYKGRSDNFGELRDYVDGDDVKDIDWKASARSRKMLVRQYIAEKKHNIMLVMDSNKRMLGETEKGEEKREVTIMSAGTLACLVNQNGDYVSATYATKHSIHHFPLKSGLANIENILSHYHKSVMMENDSVVGTSLDYILHHFRRRMILLIVTDTEGVLSIPEVLLKRLLVLHDILVVRIGDGDLAGNQVFDVVLGDYLPDYFTKNKKLVKIEKQQKQAMEQACDEKLRRYGIANITLDSTEDMETKIVELINMHKGGKK